MGLVELRLVGDELPLDCQHLLACYFSVNPRTVPGQIFTFILSPFFAGTRPFTFAAGPRGQSPPVSPLQRLGSVASTVRWRLQPAAAAPPR